ncbi:MinD/ParA family protein [Arthrobacter sp. MSA 4-2]|uniref:nucleotide-binding protein n=1 Tax=Arthrobacter sp. MSA 4-2 TaxID=2794349 RepID=UPI001E5C19CE|nr:MinD/ParA family protein [Arthrobacter sp. MSA 4-2]
MVSKSPSSPTQPDPAQPDAAAEPGQGAGEATGSGTAARGTTGPAEAGRTSDITKPSDAAKAPDAVTAPGTGSSAGGDATSGAGPAAGAVPSTDVPSADGAPSDGTPASSQNPAAVGVPSPAAPPAVPEASAAALWNGGVQVGPVPVIQAPLPPTLIPEIGATSAPNLLSIPVPVEPTGWRPSGSAAPSAEEPPGSTAPGTGDSAAEEPPSARRVRETGPEPASALTADRLLTGTERPPSGGWRRWLYSATLGYVNLGDSDAVRIRRATEHRIAVRLGGHTRYVPVLSRKGGVGKTTVTTLLGMALADMREDRIIAMDANPDRGTLSDRSPGRADFTARQLVQNRFMVDSFAQLAHYVTRDGSRLHVLASDTDPAVAQAFDDADYRAVTDILGRYYSIVLTDSGTGMVHSVMKGTLEKADTVVLVSGGSVDEARLASETLSWLEAHGRHDLVAKAIVVVNLSSGNGTQVRVGEIEEHFLSRVGTVVRIPYDRHLAEGSRIDLAKLQPATRNAVIELAALVVDELHD